MDIDLIRLNKSVYAEHIKSNDACDRFTFVDPLARLSEYIEDCAREWSNNLSPIHLRLDGSKPSLFGFHGHCRETMLQSTAFNL